MTVFIGQKRALLGGLIPPWLPSALFELPWPGIWLDGSDNSVMWQDAAGTTPVTALGQSVGLVLDKRLWGGKTLAQVLAAAVNEYPAGSLESNYNPAGNVSTPEFFYPRTTEAPVVVGNQLSIGGAGGLTTAKLTANQTYRWQLSWTGLTAGEIQLAMGNSSVLASSSASSGTLEATAFFAMGSANTRPYLRFSGATTCTITDISFKEIPGNHASQSSSSSRPVWQENDLGARGLLSDGVNDNLVTPSIDFSGSDKMLVAAGVRKLSDANIAMLAELSADLGSNNGSFYLAAPVSAAAANYTFNSKGSAAAQASYTDASVAAPTSNVLVGLGDIGGDISRLRVDGGQVAENTGDQGSGNFGNYPLYIGRRGGSTLPYNGFLHQLVIRGGAWPNAAELAQLEAYLASKSGVNL